MSGTPSYMTPDNAQSEGQAPAKLGRKSSGYYGSPFNTQVETRGTANVSKDSQQSPCYPSMQEVVETKPSEKLPLHEQLIQRYEQEWQPPAPTFVNIREQQLAEEKAEQESDPFASLTDEQLRSRLAAEEALLAVGEAALSAVEGKGPAKTHTLFFRFSCGHEYFASRVPGGVADCENCLCDSCQPYHAVVIVDHQCRPCGGSFDCVRDARQTRLSDQEAMQRMANCNPLFSGKRQAG
jgi:hypothetical protein